MTEKEYEEECNKVIMEYFRIEERIAAGAKKAGIWSRDPAVNDHLFHDTSEEMHAKLSDIRELYYH